MYNFDQCKSFSVLIYLYIFFLNRTSKHCIIMSKNSQNILFIKIFEKLNQKLSISKNSLKRNMDQREVHKRKYLKKKVKINFRGENF